MPTQNKKLIPIFDGEYQNWLQDLKSRYKQSQIKAAVQVNSELLRFYWSLGRDIVKMKAESKWGSGFFESLSNDLRTAFKNSGGFSVRNLRSMKYFYCLFPLDQDQEKEANPIWQQLVSKIFLIPWGHMIYIVRKAQGI